jgi:hypothetical protein
VVLDAESHPGPAAIGESLEGRHDERINPAKTGEIVRQGDQDRRLPRRVETIDALKDAVAELRGRLPRAVLE